MGTYSIIHHGQDVEHVAVMRNESSGEEVRVAVGCGFNVYSFSARTSMDAANQRRVDFLYTEPGFPKAGMRATANGTPILAPFPNRIAGGTYRYGSKTYSLPCNDHGRNAIHGFAFERPWRVMEENTSTEAAVLVGEFEMLRDSLFTLEHWPGDFRLQCRLTLNQYGLRQQFTIKNIADVRIPFGLGTHPYFRMPAADGRRLDDCTIRCDVDTLVVLDKTIPTGETKPLDDATRPWAKLQSRDGNPESSKKLSEFRVAAPIGARTFDHVFTGMTPQSFVEDGQEKRGDGDKARYQAVLHSLTDVRETIAYSLGMTHDPDFRYVVVYIPPHRRAICIEPYTCVTNAVNLGVSLGANGPPTGLWHLAPGEEREVAIRMFASVFDPALDGPGMATPRS